jgi:hypothetical protein
MLSASWPVQIQSLEVPSLEQTKCARESIVRRDAVDRGHEAPQPCELERASEHDPGPAVRAGHDCPDRYAPDFGGAPAQGRAVGRIFNFCESLHQALGRHLGSLREKSE